MIVPPDGIPGGATVAAELPDDIPGIIAAGGPVAVGIGGGDGVSGGGGSSSSEEEEEDDDVEEDEPASL